MAGGLLLHEVTSKRSLFSPSTDIYMLSSEFGHDIPDKIIAFPALSIYLLDVSQRWEDSRIAAEKRTDFLDSSPNAAL